MSSNLRQYQPTEVEKAVQQHAGAVLGHTALSKGIQPLDTALEVSVAYGFEEGDSITIGQEWDSPVKVKRVDYDRNIIRLEDGIAQEFPKGTSVKKTPCIFEKQEIGADVPKPYVKIGEINSDKKSKSDGTLRGKSVDGRIPKYFKAWFTDIYSFSFYGMSHGQLYKKWELLKGDEELKLLTKPIVGGQVDDATNDTIEKAGGYIYRTRADYYVNYIAKMQSAAGGKEIVSVHLTSEFKNSEDDVILSDTEKINGP